MSKSSTATRRGLSTGALDSFFLSMTAINGMLYFGGPGAGGSGYALWRTDGTAAGTELLQNFNTDYTGTSSSVVTARCGSADSEVMATVPVIAGLGLWGCARSEFKLVNRKKVKSTKLKFRSGGRRKFVLIEVKLVPASEA